MMATTKGASARRGIKAALGILEHEKWNGEMVIDSGVIVPVICITRKQADFISGLLYTCRELIDDRAEKIEQLERQEGKPGRS